MITIQADTLTKVYQQGSVEVAAVRGISLTVEAGEIVAVVGPSGSGKTTLLSMLGCILRPTAGQLTVCGESVTELDEEELPFVRRHYIGFIFQSFNLFTALTAVENIEIALTLKGAAPSAARHEAQALLSAVGLGDRARFLPRDLSGGEKQRVSIARALAGAPPIILADEPTANLDWKTGEPIMRLLHHAAKRDRRTVVVVTHDARVTPYADRIVHIEDGQVVG